jgi:ATP-binding cassette, subfamily B, multidrug efflux pump
MANKRSDIDDSIPAVGDWQTTRRLFSEIERDKKYFFLALLLYIPILLMQLAQPLVIGQAVDEGFRELSLSAVTKWAGIYVLTIATHSIFDVAQLFVMQLMGLRAVRALRNRLFRKIQRLPMSYFDYVPLGKVMTRVTNDVESLSELFSSGAVRIVGDILFLIGTLVMLFLVDWQLSLATILVIPVLVVGVQLFRTRARSACRRVRTILSRINGYLQEHLSGMHIVQLFGQQQRVKTDFTEENKSFMLANREAIAIDAGVYAFVDAMSMVAVAVVLFAGASMQDSGALTLGVLVAFIEALGRFFMPIRELSNKYTVIQSAFASAERIYELEDQEEEIVERELPHEAIFEEELRCEGIHFAYGDGPAILRDLSFRVKKGERVAIVGHTGSGKSTIVKLLSRTYDVQQGSISLDGTDIRDIRLLALRKLFTSVPQDVFLFSGTIRSNLCFGRNDISDAELLEAIQICQAELILERHGGLDGEVTERGQNVSLGERQLLALVRALVTNPPILILDEATASVDRDTERRLQAATEKLMENRTAIIVAHRLSTIRNCDRIMVLHHGNLKEEGTHDELVALGGFYATLVALQEREGG